MSSKGIGKGDRVGKSKSSNPTKHAKSSRDKGTTSGDALGYDDTRFLGKGEEHDYNSVWEKNGAVIEREFKLQAFDDLGFGYFHDFTMRGWVKLAEFKAESILVLCQEFMANVQGDPEFEKGREKITSWVRGKRIVVTPDTFAEIFELPRVENPEYDLPDTGIPDMATLSQEITLEGDNWDGEVQCNKMRLKDKYLILFLFSCHSLMPLKRTVDTSKTRAGLLWAIGTGKSIDLPRIMYTAMANAVHAFDPRGSVPFTGFLTALFVKYRVPIPMDLRKSAPEKAIDRSSLNRSEGQRKKRRMAIAASGSAGIAGLEATMESLRTDFDTRMTGFEDRMAALEVQSGRHTTMLQEIKGMLVRMQPDDDDDEDED